jgi:hypothetical protein
MSFSTQYLELFAQGWLQTAILLSSASQVARIIGMSHWCLTQSYTWKVSSGSKSEGAGEDGKEGQ